MKKTPVFAFLAFAALSLHADPVTGWLQTGAGPYDYNDPANWVDGVINGVFGSDLTLTAAQTVTFGADTELPGGLAIGFAGGYRITFASDDTSVAHTLTLGGGIAVTASAKNCGVTFDGSLVLDLGGESRTVSNANGNCGVTFGAVLQNGALVASGTSGFTLSAVNTYEGGTVVRCSGALTLGTASSLGSGTVTVLNGGVLGASQDITLANDIVFDCGVDGTVSYSSNASKTLTLAGGLYFPEGSFKISVGKGTLALSGDIEEGDITNIVKAGGATLRTTYDLVLGSPTTLQVLEGTWNFNGSLSGGSLVKTGGGQLFLNAANSYTGLTDIREGTLKFAVAGSLPNDSEILIASGATLTSDPSKYTVAALLASGQIRTESAGTIAIGAADSSNPDFTGYPGLSLGSNGNQNFSGTITPADGVYRIGGGGGYLYILAENALSGKADVVVSGDVWLRAPNNVEGVITVTAGRKLTLEDAIKDKKTVLTQGCVPNADIVAVDGATVALAAEKGGSATRLKSLELRASTLTVSGSTAADTQHSITGPITIVPGSTGGHCTINVSTGAGYLTTLSAPRIVREHGETAAIFGIPVGVPANSASYARILLDTPPPLLGDGGAAGTTTMSICPFLWGRTVSGSDNVGGLITYELPYGLRLLDNKKEYLSAIPDGETEVAHNIRVPQTQTTTVTQDTLINAICLVGGESGTASTMVNGTGLLTIKSGALFYGYHRNKMAYVKCPVDFGDAQGVIYYSRGKPTYLQNALHGTGGAVFAQYAGGTASGSGGTGLSWTSGDATTLSGDIFVTGKLNAEWNFLKHSDERPMNVDVTGMFVCNVANVGRLTGWGRIIRDTHTFTFGLDDSDALYGGTFEGTLPVVKAGTGTQRLTGASTHTGRTTVSNGVLVVDGSFSGSPVTVREGATLAGCGSLAKAVTMQSGSTLECGSAEMPEDEEMSFGATLDCADGTTMRFQAGRGLTTTAAVVAGAVTGAGTNTVTVSVAGEGSGEWLLLEAASISPKFVLDGNGGRLIRRTTDTTEQIWYTRCEGTLILFR